MTTKTKNDSVDEAVSKNVIDYYKKYSQNPDLPKYFSGSSLSYLPEFKENFHETQSFYENPPQIIIQSDFDIVITDEQNEPESTSRASSAMSNKKLEWDNGADIGYSNCQNPNVLRKSSSLPIIGDNNKKDQVTTRLLEHSANFRSDGTHKAADKIKLYIFTHSDSESPSSSRGVPLSSTSSSSSIQEKQIQSSTSSSTGNLDKNKMCFSSSSSNQKSILDFACTSSFLKKKIGLPGAQSTPNDLDNNNRDEILLITETPKVPNFEKRLQHTKVLLDNIKKPKETERASSKIVETTNNSSTRTCRTNFKQPKSVKLCLTKPIFVECLSNSKESPKKELPRKLKYATVGIQTDALLSKELVQIVQRHSIIENQGLEFCEHSDSDPNAVGTQTSSDLIVSNCNSFEYMKNDEQPKILKSSYTDNHFPNFQLNKDQLPISSIKERSDSIEDISISSNILSDDIEKNTSMLQKLMKSKKYDNGTKKRYIKKILHKIIESKYLEESSNSSELFVPKKLDSGIQNLAVPPLTDSSSKSVPDQNTLKSYTTTCSQCHKVSPRKRKSTSKILTAEISSRIQREDMGELPVLLPNQRENEIRSCSLNFNKASPKENHKIEISSELSNSDSNLKSSSYQNWKEDKTYSEKLYEEHPQTNGDGNYLNQVADNERRYQINWINNEINHLGKLKNLLQQQGQNKIISSNEPNKFKSVYEISGENDSNVDQNSDSSRRRYVIETNLGPTLSHSRRFKIGDRSYNVKDLSESSPVPKENNNDKHVVGNIEVLSSEETLNIKVTTFCGDCKKAPCVCMINSSKNNKKKRLPTINDESSLSQSFKSLGRTRSCCHRLYDINAKLSPRLERHCPLCLYDSCNCSDKTSSKEDIYTGQFIPLLTQKQNSQNTPTLKKRNAVEALPRCLVCLKIACQCEKIRQDGSLKKVFENCTCKPQFPCNCGFVDKLYKHFNISNDTKGTIAVQTDLNLVNTQIQTDIQNGKAILQQTEKQQSTETIGVQCKVDLQDASAQISSDSQNHTSQTKYKVIEKSDTGVDAIKFEIPADNIAIQTSIPQMVDQSSQMQSIKFQSQYQQTDMVGFLDESTENFEAVNIEKIEQNGINPQINGYKLTTRVRKSSPEYAESLSKISDEKVQRIISSENKTTQNSPSMVNSATSSTAISLYDNYTSTTSSTSVTCICCKKITDKKNISMFQYDNEVYPLCCKCVRKKPVLTSVCYTGPEYVCCCSQTEPVDSPEQMNQEYCTCVKPFQYKNTGYCLYCQFKLRKTLKSKNGIAYTLTLEYDSPRRHRSKKRRKKELEEIKVKIPSNYSKKKHKDKENLNRKEQLVSGPSDRTNYLDDSSPNKPNKTVDSTNEDNVRTFEQKESQKEKVRRVLSLQEHLMQNRPDFIDSAENRRHALITSKQDREIRKDHIKIKFFEENITNLKNERPKLFSEREMREITRKNYKKLPEVQQKLKNNKEQTLRKADKFIVNTFTKKIQKSILKGKSSFPINTNIVDVYK